MKQDQFEAGKSFLNWIDKKYPGSRAEIIKRANAPIATAYLQGLGQGGAWPMLPSVGTIPGTPFPSGTLQPATLPEPEPAWYEKLASAAATVVPAYFTYKQQDKLTDMQIERMKRGLPPVEDPTQYMPAVKVQHQVDTRALARQFTPSTETKNMLWVGGGVAAVLLFLMFQK